MYCSRDINNSMKGEDTDVRSNRSRQSTTSRSATPGAGGSSSSANAESPSRPVWATSEATRVSACRRQMTEEMPPMSRRTRRKASSHDNSVKV